MFYRMLTRGAALLVLLPAAPLHAQNNVAERMASLAIMSAHPRALWLPNGRLAYAASDGHRALDPRTGEEEPFPASPASPPGRVVRHGLFKHHPPVLEVLSADERWLAGTHNGNLWIRSVDGRDSLQLTTDGSLEHAYDVEGARWSPDGRRIAVRRYDHRGVPTLPIVRWKQPGHPVEQLGGYSRAGDPIPRVQVFIADARGAGGRSVELATGGEPYIHIVGWSDDGTALYALRLSRLLDRLDFLAVDADNGHIRTILSETSSTFIGGLPFLQGYTWILDRLNHAVVLDKSGRFVWTSEHDGWRRLYLYGIDGTLQRPLTPTGYDADLVSVDAQHGWVYYIGWPDPLRPYDQALLRVRIDGGAPERLVDGPVINDVALEAGGEFLWVMRSGRAQLPVAELRRSDGALIRQFWSADPALLERARLPQPAEFVVKAADSTTDLHGLLYTPRPFDPARSYPVVENIYAGAWTTHVPQSMRNFWFWFNQVLADEGFLVVVADGRGTPGRGKAFQDATHGRIGQVEISDHAAVIRQLAAQRPYMDLQRVGVIGGSWGGYFVIRAMLLEPELYKVGVAWAPTVDLEHFRVAIEPFMGCLPAGCPEAYSAGANTTLARQLKGELLLMHGTSDDDVPFAETIRMISALIAAGKPYDLVVFPEGYHSVTRDFNRFWEMMLVRYLRRHLRP